jgi:Uma2 family endonuclease
MNTVFTPTRMRITVDRYQKMVAAGVLTPSDRVELIEGEILDMAPIGTRHASVTGRLVKRLVLSLGEAATVRAANPIDLGSYSEPEPDLLVLKPRTDDYMRAHPQAQDVLLLIEVADTSLAFDQGAKRELYARFGVSEYWVVDLNDQRIFAYFAPAQGAFQRHREYLIDETISPQVFPDVKFAVRELFA